MFITLEGIDGCGKSTQSERLAKWLTEYTGHETVRTYEPGGYRGGESLRKFILESWNFCAKSELLLFLADRAEHVSKVIAPALSDGRNVICERWNESTLAYQSGGHELRHDEVMSLIEACDFPEPDVKIFLDVEPEAALSRIRERTQSDKFEEEGLALMRKVAQSYRNMCRIECSATTPLPCVTPPLMRKERGPGGEVASLHRLTRIDCGTLSEDEVFAAIIAEISAWRSR